MPSDRPDLLATIAQELLNASLQGLREAGLDIPPRVFVECGNVSAPVELDGCTDQLTCVIPSIQPSLTTEGMQRRAGAAAAGTLWQTRFEITLLRCHPLNQSGIPDPQETDLLAKEHMSDGWQLLRSLSWRWHHKELVPSFAMDLENTQMGTFTCLPPRGGIRGWTFSFTSSVHDYYQPG